MADLREVPVRELRNHTSDVLRRVAAGESLSVTVNGKPIADLVPHVAQRTWVPMAEILKMFAGSMLDENFDADVDTVLSDTVDDL